MRLKKAQSAGGAAAFVAILTLLIILYILFLPPDIRNELLSETPSGTGSGSTSTASSTILLKQTIGRVDYIKTNEKNYDLPTVRIQTPTSAQLIKSVNSAKIKNGIFDKDNKEYSMDFDIDTLATNNILLSFAVDKYSGPLLITLNGRPIFSSEIKAPNPSPITLDKAFLTGRNTIVFSSPDPGWAFWRINTYTLSRIQITADVTDFSNSFSDQYFTISEAEKNNLETIKLSFNPVCIISDIGALEIELNKKLIFRSIADCGTKTYTELDKEGVFAGSNLLRFSTTKGKYLLDNMKIELRLTKPAYNTYFFDMDKDYFKSEIETARCGDYDSVCPVGCHEQKDADCCFRQNGYWCALPTDNPNDRCVFYIEEDDCGLCMSGYYDESGDPHENCEEKCGDNTDDNCPSDCPSPSRYYDMDCCHEYNPDYFWCEEVPLSGISDKCRASISRTYCDLCPSGYEDEDGSEPDSCSASSYTYTDYDYELQSNYDVKLTVRFTNDNERKRVRISVNGREIAIDSTKIEFTRNIDDYVREGTNSVEIIPQEDVDIAEIKVDLIRVS